MADRTYNEIDIDVFNKPWSRVARRIWAHILLLQPNPYGIFDSQLGVIYDFWNDIYEPHEVDSAIRELVDLGALKTYRNGNVWWVVKKFKRGLRYHQSIRHRSGVEKHLKRYPDVEQDFRQAYKEYFMFMESPHSADPEIRARDTKGIVGALNPLPNTDSDTDTERTNTTQPAVAGEADAPPVVVPVKKAKKVKPVEALPDLGVLEDRVDAEAYDGYIQWRDACCRSNKSGEMADTKIARLLADVLKAVGKDEISGEALGYGFQQAAGAEAPNANYVLKAARGYRRKPSGNGRPGNSYVQSEGVGLPDGMTYEEFKARNQR